MSEFIVKKFGRTKPKKAILIAGLPGTGNVGRIVVDYLITSLKAKKHIEIFSTAFPNSVFVEGDSTIRLPSVSLWYVKKGRKELLLLTGDMQPLDEEKSYALSKVLMSVAKKENVKEIITIGGIGLSKEPSKPKVHGVASNKKYLKDLKNLVILDGNKTVGFIVGVSGLLLGLAQLEGIKAVSFLGETYNHPAHFGIKTAHEVLKKLVKYLNMKVSLASIEKEVKALETRIKKEKMARKEIAKAMKRTDKEGLRYIG